MTVPHHAPLIVVTIGTLGTHARGARAAALPARPARVAPQERALHATAPACSPCRTRRVAHRTFMQSRRRPRPRRRRERRRVHAAGGGVRDRRRPVGPRPQDRQHRLPRPSRSTPCAPRELERWRTSGEYDAIIAGTYPRRGDPAPDLGRDFAEASRYYSDRARNGFNEVSDALTRAADAFREAFRGGASPRPRPRSPEPPPAPEPPSAGAAHGAGRADPPCVTEHGRTGTGIGEDR